MSFVDGLKRTQEDLRLARTPTEKALARINLMLLCMTTRIDTVERLYGWQDEQEAGK